jgi:Ca-activated chloride channel family protein
VQIASTTFSSNRDGLVADMKSLDYGNGTRLWDGLAAGMDLLRGIEGRRVILVFTDGDDTTSKTSLGTVLDRAQIEEVMIYGIGFRSEYIDPASGRMIRSRPDRSLKRIADETGGGYFEVDKKGDLGSAFTRVAQELHSQYVLGFTPMTLDGKVHKLAVRVKQSGMIARARKSYVATPDKLTAPEKPFR